MKKVKFTDYEAPVPNDTNEYLTALYGPNYMIPPSEDQQEKHVVYEFDLGNILMKNDLTRTAVIFAGGVGSRMHSKDLPKQFLRIHGKPILIWTVEEFESCPEIDSIVVVCVDKWLDYCKHMFAEFTLPKVKIITAGGKTGQLSIREGLLAAATLSDPRKTVVLIHDGVRPLIDKGTIERCIDSVVNYGSAITCVPAKETILVEDGGRLQIIPREKVLLARAPQAFWLSDILDAHKKPMKKVHFHMLIQQA